MIWANSSAGDGYIEFWHRELTVGWGAGAITEDLTHWVNDGLMALFFFVVGLEIKRELAVGELRERRAAVLPVFAALGGVRAAGAALRPAGAGRRGPGRVGRADGHGHRLRRRHPGAARRSSRSGAKLLLLSVAIVDDILAIVVIAVFYTDAVNLAWLAVALAVCWR